MLLLSGDIVATLVLVVLSAVFLAGCPAKGATFVQVMQATVADRAGYIAPALGSPTPSLDPEAALQRGGRAVEA